MSKSVRLSEKWFNYCLWAVAIIFASFLIGLGSLIVESIPKLQSPVSEEQFLDKRALTEFAIATERTLKELHDQGRVRDSYAQTQRETDNAYRSARATFENWLATREKTQRSDQNPEVVRRARELDTLKLAHRQAEVKIETADRKIAALHQQLRTLQKNRQVMSSNAHEKVQSAKRKHELHTFLYRLSFTLPLLILSGWLFKTKRKSAYWPFVTGFSLFSIFVFFFELVPYLPSYGGYVRYIVGILLTVLGGRYIVQALKRYREKQAIEEQKPDEKRRHELSYEIALSRLAKRACPGCERPIDLENKDMDFCHHCGIAVYNKCTKCEHRKSAFSKFCMKCGELAN